LDGTAYTFGLMDGGWMAVDRDPRTKRLRPGSVLNPAGRNQYDSRRARLDAITDQIAGEVEEGCEGTREERLVREIWKRAQDGNAAFAKLLLDRVWPAVKSLEVGTPAPDFESLEAALDRFRERRSEGCRPHGNGSEDEPPHKAPTPDP
jgi:hypothetical protein